ncbi:MAG: hypothetical protein ACOYOV_15210 [Bacteroidales bacterium]
MAIVGNVKAQDATLDETLEFLTLKSYDYLNPRHGGNVDHEYDEEKFVYNKEENRINFVVYILSTDHTITKIKYYIDLNSNVVIMLDGKYVRFISGVKYDKYFEDIYAEKKVNTFKNDTPHDIRYNEDNGTRAFKAFKHLFKLLNKEITIKESVENKF